MRCALVLVLICGAQAGGSAWWLHRSGFLARPPALEDAYRRLTAARMKAALRREGPLRWIERAPTWPGPQPPLLFFVTSAIAARRDDPEVRVSDLWAASALF